jgi:DNA modification methylase
MEGKMKTLEYNEFIESKKRQIQNNGFEINRSDLNPKMFEYQKDITQIAIKKGKYAVFADCGLGKTFIQLEWARLIGGKVLILAPLEVCHQTIREAKTKLNFNEPIKYIESQNDIIDGINITNYEKLHKFDCECFNGIVLDESSILKNYTGKIKTLVFEKFKNTKYKLSCTATPSPNDHMEILNQAEFLDVIKSSEALSEWFINDTMNFGGYRLKGHAKDDFYRWLCSWSVSIDSPSDLGYSDDGFKLPELNIKEVTVNSNNEICEDGKIFRVPERLNATNFNKEKRMSLQSRLEFTMDKVNNSKEQWIIWCETNEESELLAKHINDSFEVRGATPENVRKEQVELFLNRKLKVIISKTSIFGFGLNFQNCNNTLFFGLSFSYEDFYQAVKRFHRFGQNLPVNAYIVIGENEKSMLDCITEKKKKHLELKDNMKANVKKYQDLEFGKSKEFKSEYTKREFKNQNMHLINGDSVEEIKNIPSESVDFQIFSPPFSSLYIYSDNIRDMGNCKNDSEFMQQFGYLIPELKRILRTGRLIAVHCKQLVNYAGTSGMAGLRDFRGDLIRAFTKHGLSFHSEVFIWKDPVIEMQRTKAQGLLYKQLRKDSSYSRVGMPEYLLLFRKWGDRELEIPVDWKTKDNFELDKWQNYASPCWESRQSEKDFEFYRWMDIKQTNVLNSKIARNDADEKHICPLQLDVIERAIEMWTNPDDVVFTPFLGIGSEIYQALKMGRRGVGIELKPEYYDQAVEFCSGIDEYQQFSLF